MRFLREKSDAVEFLTINVVSCKTNTVSLVIGCVVTTTLNLKKSKVDSYCDEGGIKHKFSVVCTP